MPFHNLKQMLAAHAALQGRSPLSHIKPPNIPETPPLDVPPEAPPQAPPVSLDAITQNPAIPNPNREKFAALHARLSGLGK